MVDEFGTPKAFEQNVELEYQRNMERYQFLKWGADRVRQFQGRAPGTGICPPGEPRAHRKAVWSAGLVGRGSRLSRHLGRHRTATRRW
jgi:aconitate hydratase